MVSNKGVIMTATYHLLPEDKGAPFGGFWFWSEDPVLPEVLPEVTDVLLCSTDLQLYNEALKVLQDFPQFYPFEAGSR